MGFIIRESLANGNNRRRTGVFSPQNQPLEQVYQPASALAAVAYTLGKAIVLIPERRGYLKSVVTAKHRLFPKFGAEETVTEQRK